MIGVDITDLTRIRLDPSFLRHLLTEREMEEYEQRKSERRKIEYAGGRFAAKEAIFKATGAPDFLSWSVLNGPDGKPYILDHPELEISISHDGNFAIAAVKDAAPSAL